MPPKQRKWLREYLAAKAEADANPVKRPLPRAGWEDQPQVKSRTQFKKSVTFSNPVSSASSKDNFWDFASSPLIAKVRATTEAEEYELQCRRDPLYRPKRLRSDTQYDWTQLLLRHQEHKGRKYPTKEAREQQKALARLSAQDASPIDLRPFESNFFRQ
jgi:hypothetical protein